MDGSAYRDLLRPIFEERRVIPVGGVVAAWTTMVPQVRGLGATDVLVIGTRVDWGRTASGAGRGDRVRPASSAGHLDAGRHSCRSRAAVGVVPAERAELLTAAVRRANDAGSVWSGDAREGFNGGAEFVRWVRTSAEADDAVRFFAAHCDRVRVMPFLDGIPCSVHGIVFPDHIAALRPVEMVALRHPVDGGSGRSFYAGCASFYDPPASVRQHMRSVARTVDAGLRAEVGYRGAFTVDGVVSGDRLRPHRAEPQDGRRARYHRARSAGIARVPDGRAGRRGRSPLRPGRVRGRLAGRGRHTPRRRYLAAGRRRDGGTTGRRATDLRRHAVAMGGFRRTNRRDAHHRTRSYGTFLRCMFDPTETPTGGSVAGRAAAFWAFADRELSTGVGPLTPATT